MKTTEYMQAIRAAPRSGLQMPLANVVVVSLLFIAAYLVLERLTFIHQLDGLGITLWGPSAGLALLFLMWRGPRYAPAVLLASLVTDFTVYTGPRGVIAPLATSLVLAGGLTALTMLLRSRWHLQAPRLKQIVLLLLVVPAGVLAMALAYCLVLLATGHLNPGRFLIAVRNFWIGDTLGILTVVPFASAVVTGVVASSRSTGLQLRNSLVFLSALAVALALIFSVDHAREYQFFYLLFLPITWMAIREGFTGAAIGLFVTHVLLVSTALAQGFGTSEFVSFQTLMLVLSATGLLLGGAISEIRGFDERVRKQEADLSRATRQALVGATGTALAHEVSQPLASATNYLHAARTLLESQQASPEFAKALTMAAGEAERARVTLERVRDYLASGRVDLQDVDVMRVAKSIAASVTRDPRYDAVNINVVKTSSLPRVAADPVQLQQVLHNLVTNAAEAVTQSGQNARTVTIHADSDAEWVTVHVDDDGPGVSASIADRLFEPFETASPSGMGLGLTLVRQIVDAHGGKVVWSNRGRGARFSVSLPRNKGGRHD